MSVEKPYKHEAGVRTGWLFNYHNTSEALEADEGKEAPSASAVQLMFLDLDGDVFEATLQYKPYFLVSAVEGHEREVELGIMSLFGGGKQVAFVQQIEKEDLSLVNHLSGKKRTFLKVVFFNTTDLTAVRGRLEVAVRRNQSMSGSDENLFQSNVGFTAVGGLFGMDGMSAPSMSSTTTDSLSWMSKIRDIHEYDVKYGVRVAIDLGVYVGLWYDVTVTAGVTAVERCDDSKYAPAMPRVVAFDIETTKAPLKFPQPEVDQIYMISYMVDGRGFLIVNREIVADDIGAFEYTPRPEYEGHFATFNEPDEYHTLRRFYDELKRHKPQVFVTYNGDYFDFPFIHARSTVHGMNMRQEIGFAQGAEGATLNQKLPHLDCFYWVKRDSYLPQGSQGLKAVTKYKLGFDPIEVDPEDMLPLAQTNPQRMASYSVSDAVSTYYLYMKYVHPFIFSLCTIIPMQADEVLRRGSGTLCESLLMVQAYAKNVVFPAKQQQQREKFYNGHLIDSETYIGGRVEALKSGVYRSNIDMHFRMNPLAYQGLIDKLDDMLRFAIEVEGGVKLSDVNNYDTVRATIQQGLEALRDRPDRHETPLIYHLDVGAMYPNIILTNRLQPSSMVTADICAGCCFNTPGNDFKCKRDMSWVWKGEMFTANRHEYMRIKSQLESESFSLDAVAKADVAAVQKKTYGNRSGNVLEGTTFDKPKDQDWKKKKDGEKGGAGGYRKMSDRQRREAKDALLKTAGGSDDDGGDDSDGVDEDGMKHFNKLQENTQFSMLKKRLAEYSRRAYGKIHEAREIRKTNTVCQRENSFYVDTVRLFRDRRYFYKAELKKWKTNLDKATDPQDVKIAKSRCVQMESLQLAHKCILNSFYGYVMRKGSRWYSMEMAGIVTYLGAGLIQVARTLVQQIGETLELDTDGIWCCLPKSFPENFTFTTTAGKKVSISFPCVMLNKDVHDIYTNHQYQEFKSVGQYEIRSECSIYFEVDGPYLAMILPASREEGKSIKKRYAVFHPDGRLAELKGFELKRRGELMLIKDFQSQVFKRFLEGATLREAFDCAAVVANSALDMLYNEGEGYDADEVIEKLTESSNMTRRLCEYPETQKSLALTTARRIAEFLGPQMVKDKGLACHFVISKLPRGKPVTERAIPLTIFKADPSVRIHFLRKWTGDHGLPNDCQLKDLLDWEYYIARFNGCVQKIISIPAALQGLTNPVPRVAHPDWLHKRIQQQNSKFRQVNLTSMFSSAAMKKPAPVDVAAVAEDVEDIAGRDVRKPANASSVKKLRQLNAIDIDSEADDADEERDGMATVGSDADDDVREDAEAEKVAEAARRETQEQIRTLQLKYFTPENTRPLDPAFFAADGFRPFHAQQRQAWLHRAKLRKEILGDKGGRARSASDLPVTVASTMDHLLLDSKSKALGMQWHVVEVRNDPDQANVAIVFAVLDKSLHRFRVLVPRTVLVDALPTASFHEAANVKSVSGRVLPRHKPATHLFEVTVGDFKRNTGDDDIEMMRYLRDDVFDVYEADLTASDRLIFQMGCVANVRGPLHLQNVKERNGAHRDMFTVPEFEACATAHYLAASSSTPIASSTTTSSSLLGNSVFIYHVASENRGVLAALHTDSGKGVFVVVQPSAAQRAAFNWQALSDAGLEAVGLTGPRPLNPVVHFEAEMADGWGRLTQFLLELSSGPLSTRPILAVVQSPLATDALLHSTHLPQLATLPIVRTLGSAEDEKWLQDAFRWSRLLARRAVQRFYAASFWIDERLQVARIAGVPIANLSHDVPVAALDVMFRRQLRRRGHVLWDYHDANRAAEIPNERARHAVVEGGHYTWAVEFSLAQIDVISVLFSQTIQEGDDPSARALADNGATSYFLVLRELLSELMGQAVAGKRPAAAQLLVSFARWLRDTASASYEPRLVELVSTFVHRALAALMLRITRLGGKILRASTQSVLVHSSKVSLKDAVHFAQFLCTSLKDQPLLGHLHLQPIRYWSPFVIIHHHDYCNQYVDADAALQWVTATMTTSVSETGGAVTGASPVMPLQSEFHFTLLSRFTASVQERFKLRLAQFLDMINAAKATVLGELASDATVSLATRADRLHDRVCSAISQSIERELQPLLLDEVTEMLENRVVLLDPRYALDAGVGASSTTPLQQQPKQQPSASDSVIEYVKMLCYMMSCVPGVEAAVRKTKNNCLRLCGIGPFSPAAEFHKRLDHMLTLETRCCFCNVENAINVMAILNEVPLCATCETPFPMELIEAELVRRVTRRIRAYCEQDYVCRKCRQVTPNMMSSCCGELVGKETAAVQTDLKLLLQVASRNNMQILSDVVSFAASGL